MSETTSGGDVRVDDKVIVLADLDRAMRRQGAGASLDDLARDMGVDENVIHVAFPQGREQMIGSVLGSACDEFDEVVTDPMIAAPTQSEALREAADGLAAYYEGGARQCLFDLFSVPDDAGYVPAIKDTAARFLDGLTEVLTRSGRAEQDARAKATRLFAELQGTLILSRLTGDHTLFRTFTDSLARTR